MTRPLFGKVILLTRPAGDNQEAADLIRKRGGEPVEIPLIAVDPPDDWGPADNALDAIGTFDLILFTSANGVAAVMNRLKERQIDPFSLPWPAAAAVGPKTAQAVEESGLRVSVVPENFKGEGLAASLSGSVAGRKILFPRAAKVRRVLPDSLVAFGADLTEVVVYQTRPIVYPPGYLAAQLAAKAVNAVLLASPSAAASLAANFGGGKEAARWLRRVTVAVIGPVTAKAVEDLGIPVAVNPDRYTVTDLVDGLEDYFRSSVEE